MLKAARGASEAARNFIKSTLVRVISEINIRRGIKVAKGVVEVSSEVLKDIAGIYTKAAERLEYAGVIFARITDEQGTDRYTALYKGEELVPAISSKR